MQHNDLNIKIKDNALRHKHKKKDNALQHKHKK